MAKIDTEQIVRYSWIPIPVFISSIIILKITGQNQVYDNHFLMTILNLIFSTTASLLVVYLISRSFLVSGKTGLILISCGALSWGFAGFFANIFSHGDINLAVTIHDLSIGLSSLFYFSGALIMLRQTKSVRYPGLWLTILYSVTLTLVALIIIFSIEGKIPLFFTHNQGGTGLSYFVLSVSIIMFVATALILKIPGNGFLSRFNYWYSIGLWIIATGLFGVMLENNIGDLQSWCGRSAQYLGGVYMAIAAFACVRETKVWELSIERKQVEEQKEFHALVLETMYDSFIATDERFHITAWNRAAEILYGWKAEEVIGMDSLDVLRSNMPAAELQQLLSDLKDSGVALYETIQLRKDGTLVNVEARISAIRDNNDNISGYVAVNRDITERKRNEEALRASEQRLKFHFENSPLAVVEWNSDFVVTQWSIEAENIFGWEKADVIGKRIDSLNIIFEEDIPIVNSTMEKLIGGKEQTVISTNRNYKRTGEVIECTWYNSILLDENNKMSSVMSLVQDITLRRKAEDALRESEEKFATIFSKAPIAMSLASVPHGILYDVNQAWLDLVGIANKKDVLGKTSVEMGLLPDENSRLRILEEFQRKGVVQNAEITAKRSDGAILTILVNVHVIDIGQHKFVLSTNEDITELKRADTEREILLSELNEAQQKLNLALENGNIGIWEWDLKTDKVIWDERMERMFGFKPGEFGGTYKSFAALVNEEDISHVNRAVTSAIEKNVPFETIFRIKNLAGKTKYISSKALLNQDDENMPVSLTGVSFDVTEMREGTEKLILKLNEELLRSNKELENFAYVASHDLQEPLRMVSSFTQLLEKQYGDKLDSKAREYIMFAVDGAKRMYDLINGLLSYSRIHTRGKVFTSVNLEQVMEKVMKNLNLMIEERKGVVKSDKLPVVSGDESQMIQLFQNLIVNGIKFSQKSPEIYVSVKDEDDRFMFSVKDNGIGIEAQYFDRIFLIFQRLHPRDDFEGTGIGLAICKRIAERHGGSIWVESVPGKGSEFIFTIPK